MLLVPLARENLCIGMEGAKLAQAAAQEGRQGKLFAQEEDSPPLGNRLSRAGELLGMSRVVSVCSCSFLLLSEPWQGRD